MQDNQKLRQAGLKVTLPRIKVLEILKGAKGQHMSAEDVYKTLLEANEDIGLATIYRVLTQFESAGLVEKHHFDGSHSVFELNRPEHHDHMVCVETGKVTEFVDEAIEKLQHEIAERHGYEIVSHDLVFYVRPKKN